MPPNSQYNRLKTNSLPKQESWIFRAEHQFRRQIHTCLKSQVSDKVACSEQVVGRGNLQPCHHCRFETLSCSLAAPMLLPLDSGITSWRRSARTLKPRALPARARASVPEGCREITGLRFPLAKFQSLLSYLFPPPPNYLCNYCCGGGEPSLPRSRGIGAPTPNSFFRPAALSKCLLCGGRRPRRLLMTIMLYGMAWPCSPAALWVGSSL